MSDIFKPLKTYSFEVFAPQFIQNDYQDVTVLSLLDYQTAAQLGFDAAAMHAAIYPELPPGTVDDYATYTYLKLRTQGGDIRFVAEEWIRPDSIVVRDAATAIVTILNTSPSDGIRIRNALVSNDFKDITIVFKN